ncbi:ORF MSV104 hypothetical protein [Melanoplus sanguinipes entomopoxvirus]|uniref:Uncharacterized protein n=1 Tax=Melanoplus sanguinipes entomopoxvirus TaxID=83191 RepID=Q9YVY8_MSEPV|nr:ORF MSV104 hypothetical protein [Melanoplus sanguinipes entomopoxvirus]AAC97805.1 ORF MSV104 hypothetical protein [Melanoplus sanguinipes entomopoxvirus 'O']
MDNLLLCIIILFNLFENINDVCGIIASDSKCIKFCGNITLYKFGILNIFKYFKLDSDFNFFKSISHLSLNILEMVNSSTVFGIINLFNTLLDIFFICNFLIPCIL